MSVGGASLSVGSSCLVVGVVVPCRRGTPRWACHVSGLAVLVVIAPCRGVLGSSFGGVAPTVGADVAVVRAVVVIRYSGGSSDGGGRGGGYSETSSGSHRMVVVMATWQYGWRHEQWWWLRTEG